MISPSHYYHNNLVRIYKHLVPKNTTLRVVKDHQEKFQGKFDYLVFPNTFAYCDDIQENISAFKKHLNPNGKIIVLYYNFLWKPVLTIASKLKLRKHEIVESNWLTQDDFENIFTMSGFSEVKRGRRMLLPVDLGIISTLFNKYLSAIPFVNRASLITYQVFTTMKPGNYSVSIVIPARNEEGNIIGVLKKIPCLGTKSEIIFVEGNSKDKTYEAIEREVKSNRTKHSTLLLKQKGKGKGDAVRLGFNHASNDILMILDADLTVQPRDLHKFYNLLALGLAEFANGSRLVYPMESQAMRSLNYLGNKLFSLAFTYLLEQKVKDTLCGTKVLFRKDYELIAKNRNYFGEFDPFGDYDLLFGASKLNLKIRDVPIKYRDRTYGSTNISRFRHGWLLIQMTVFAAKKLKFI
jgi:hypothetical protein